MAPQEKRITVTIRGGKQGFSFLAASVELARDFFGRVVLHVPQEVRGDVSRFLRHERSFVLRPENGATIIRFRNNEVRKNGKHALRIVNGQHGVRGVVVRGVPPILDREDKWD